MKRVIVTLSGRVQGVGFRYTVVERAQRYEVSGTVRNVRDGERVEVDVEGPDSAVEAFIADVLANPPPLARIAHVERRSGEPRDAHGFREAPSA